MHGLKPWSPWWVCRFIFPDSTHSRKGWVDKLYYRSFWGGEYMLSIMYLLIPSIICEIVHSYHASSYWNTREVERCMKSEDDQVRSSQEVIVFFIVDLVWRKCHPTLTHKCFYLRWLVCHYSPKKWKPTHTEEFEHPSHIPIIIDDIYEDVRSFYFHVVILVAFYKIQEHLLRFFMTKKYQKVLLSLFYLWIG